METIGTMHDPRLEDHQISERVGVLTGQIQDIVDSTLRYRAKSVHTKMDRLAKQRREVRLLEIRDELGQLLKQCA